MDKKKNIVFIIPDGVGIKNYLYSNTILYLKNKAHITIWSTLPEEAFFEVKQRHKVELPYKKLSLIPENILTRFFREISTYARLNYNTKKVNNNTILEYNWKKPKNNIKLRVLFFLSKVIGKTITKYNTILKIEKASISFWSKKKISYFKKELRQLNADTVFITHQRVASIMPICIAANALKIKITTAIFSWDNLPKARLAVFADTYLVWSQWMKDEMNTYYPEIDNTKVKIVGTPQFEFYFQKEKLTNRKKFARKYKLDPLKEWICFSGDDVLTSPYDSDYLYDISSAVKKHKLNVQIIFRRSPADFSNRYDHVIKKYKNVIVKIDPLWNFSSGNWTQYYPKVDDIDLQVNLAYHCKCVINVGSTMAHDFATHNKPCLYINYNQLKSLDWSVKDIYQFQHFKSMKTLKAVGWINSKQDIYKKLSEIINNPEQVGKDRKRWLRTIALHPLENNSKLIAQALL